jgi:hypothetical protein
MNFDDFNFVNKIKATMRRLAPDCVDKDTNEINCTKLAENTAAALNLYEDDEDYTIPEEVFDLAVEVSVDMYPKGYVEIIGRRK